MVAQGDTGGKCVYVDEEGNPSCLVGHALIAMGVPSDLFMLGSTNTRSIRSLWDLINITPPAVEWAAALQGAQDDGHPWGDALTIAEKYKEDIYGVDELD